MASTSLTLTYAEAKALRDSNYPCPPGYLCPPGWELNTGGVPVSPSPQGPARPAAITQCYYVEFSHEQRMDPRWDPDNTATWDAFFAGRRERELARYEGDGPPPSDNNKAGRRLWWRGRTLGGVLEYILAGDHPRLRYPCSHATNREYLAQRAAIYASLTPQPPALVGFAHSSLEREQQGCVRHGNTDQSCSRYGRLSPTSQPMRPRPQSPRQFQPRPASDDSDDSGEYDDYEYMYYTPRQEYD